MSKQVLHLAIPFATFRDEENTLLRKCECGAVVPDELTRYLCINVTCGRCLATYAAKRILNSA